jgi:hypothetical protein
VKQGDSASPTLFAIFANDLVQEVNDLDLGFDLGGRKVSMLLYADDIVCIAQTEEDLQRILDKLRDWCRKWRVLINTDKSKCIHFRPGRRQQTSYEFRIGQNIIELVDSYKYLGVTFSYKGDFSLNAEILAKSAGRALGKVISKIRSIKEFGSRTFEKLYESCIVPIMDYCSGVWGYKTFQSIENIQHRAIRHYLGVHRFTPILALNGDMGWIPTQYRRWISIVRLWNRLIGLDDNRITKRVFILDISTCHNNWSSEIKDVFTKLNLGEHFDNREPVGLDIVKTRVRNLYSNMWSNNVANIPKLRTYRLFKTEFSQELYVNLNLKRQERSLLAQLRCGILPLRVETGRYVGEPLEQRLCRMCNSGSVEDEVHFVLNCELYKDIRDRSFNECLRDTQFLNKSDVDKFVYLVKIIPRKLAKYITLAYLKRRNTLYS